MLLYNDLKLLILLLKIKKFSKTHQFTERMTV